MEWVVTTGPTVADAKARALDALGIDEADLEWEVLQEPRTTLFGLRSTGARVRARVRPTRPRPKLDRRQRRKPKNARQRGRRRGGDDSKSVEREPAGARAEPSDTAVEPVDTAARETEAAARPPAAPESADASPSRGAPSQGEDMSDVTIDEQEPAAVAFLEGLLEAFGFEARVTAERVDDDTLELAVDGTDLGLLVGPRGNTLTAVQELTRTAVAQQQSGRLDGRLRVDVGGYRVRRNEALRRFAEQQADKVKETGERVALEPMSPPDRKIVHDTVNEIDGVHTESRGEDRRRHVVILPD